jgi:hypothetical protein
MSLPYPNKFVSGNSKPKRSKLDIRSLKCMTWPVEVLHIVTIDRINSCKYSDISLSQCYVMMNDKILYFKQVICKSLNIFN